MFPRVTAPTPRPDLWSLDPDVLHLNHGSFGAVPRRTQQVAAAMRDETEQNPMAWYRRLRTELPAARAKLAGWLGADPDGFALVPNASAGVTTALAAVPILAGSRIVITDHAYGAARFACERFARFRGAEVVTAAIPLDATDDGVVAAVSAVLDDRTAVVMLDHDLPRRFDLQATNDYVAWLAAPESLEVLAELEWPRRRAELAVMLDEAAALVAKAIGTSVLELANPAPTMRLVELPLKPLGGEEALEAFRDRSAREIGTEITVNEFGDRVWLRLSAHAYNTWRDYEQFADQLPKLL